MLLGIRHTTGLEPTVEYLLYTLQYAFALFRWDSDVVNLVPVQVCDALDTRQSFKLFDRANGDDL